MTSPFIPCPFQYNDSPNGGSVMPMIIAARNPNVTDNQYPPGYMWLSDLSQGGSGNFYIQEGFVAGIPSWGLLAASIITPLSTLSNGTTIISPLNGNIAIVGTASQIQIGASAVLNRLEIGLANNVITPGTLTVTGVLTANSGFTTTGTAQINATGNGNTTIGNAVGTGSVNIVANSVALGSVIGAAATTIQSGTGGINLSTGATTAGLVKVTPSKATIAFPTATAAINSRVGSVTFTGFTTGAAASQVFTITDSLVTATSSIFVSVSNLGINDAQMTVQRVTPGTGSFTVTVKNNGTAALNGTIILNFWVIA